MRKSFFLFVACLLVAAGIGASFVRAVFYGSVKGTPAPVVFVVEEGSGVKTIATKLNETKLISHPLFFRWFVKWTKTEKQMQSGTFSLIPGSSIAAIILELTNAKNTEVKVTIPEGFTNDQIKVKLTEVFPKFDSVAWDAETKDLQGYLFPDTYRFSQNASVKEVVEKMIEVVGERVSL